MARSPTTASCSTSSRSSTCARTRSRATSCCCAWSATDGEHVAPATFLYIAERFGLVAGDRRVGRPPGDRARRRAGAARAPPGARGQPLGPVADEPGGDRDDRARARSESADRPRLPDLRDHRDGRDREHPEGARASPSGSRSSAAASRSTTSAPASARSTTSSTCRSTCSRSTASSCATWPTPSRTRLVVKSLAQIATELGKQTVAEFVEDDETLELVALATASTSRRASTSATPSPSPSGACWSPREQGDHQRLVVSTPNGQVVLAAGARRRSAPTAPARGPGAAELEAELRATRRKLRRDAGGAQRARAQLVPGTARATSSRRSRRRARST